MTLANLLGEVGWVTWLALFVAIALAAILQVGAGVGFGSVAGPSTMLLAPQLMPATIVCLAPFASGLGAGRIGGLIAKREVAVALFGRAVGAGVIGWLIARHGSQDMFALLFAGLTLLGVALSLSGWQLPPSTVALLGAGFLSGLMGTVTSIGGPPMALIYQHQPPEKVRATLNAYFFLGAIPPIIALWLAGVIDRLSVARTLLLVAAIVVGVALSHLATRFITRRYRSILLLFCIAAALVVGGRAIARMLA